MRAGDDVQDAGAVHDDARGAVQVVGRQRARDERARTDRVGGLVIRGRKAGRRARAPRRHRGVDEVALAAVRHRERSGAGALQERQRQRVHGDRRPERERAAVPVRLDDLELVERRPLALPGSELLPDGDEGRPFEEAAAVVLRSDVPPVVRVGLGRVVAKRQLEDLPGLAAVQGSHEHVAEAAVVVQADGEHGVGAAVHVPVHPVGPVAAGMHRAGEVRIRGAQGVQQVVPHPGAALEALDERGVVLAGAAAADARDVAGVERDDVLPVVGRVAELLRQRQAVLQVDVAGLVGSRGGGRQEQQEREDENGGAGPARRGGHGLPRK